MAGKHERRCRIEAGLEQGELGDEPAGDLVRICYHCSEPFSGFGAFCGDCEPRRALGVDVHGRGSPIWFGDNFRVVGPLRASTELAAAVVAAEEAGRIDIETMGMGENESTPAGGSESDGHQFDLSE